MFCPLRFSTIILRYTHKGLSLTRKIKARFSNGKLTPLEPVELKEGEEVTVSIDDKPELSDEERLARFKAVAGGWEDNREYWENFKEYIYEARNRGID